MVKIAEAGNVENPCLLALIAKGYTLFEREYEDVPEEYAIELIAKKDGNQFSGFNAPTVLGLVTLWETRGDDWQTRDGEPFLLGSLPKEED